MRLSWLVFVFAFILFDASGVHGAYVELLHVNGAYGPAIQQLGLLGYQVLEIDEAQHSLLVRTRHQLVESHFVGGYVLPTVARLASAGARALYTSNKLDALPTLSKQQQQQQQHPTGQYLKVLLWQPLSADTAARWRHDVELHIVRRYDAEPSVVVSTVSGSARSAFQFAYDYLKSPDRVALVRGLEAWSGARLLDATGNAVIQSYQFTSCSTGPPSSYFGCTGLWNAGLDGSGQTLGVGDTGVDMRQCFFNDASCSPSNDAPKPPTCGGGSYLDAPCTSCVGYCTASQSTACVPSPSTHRTVQAFYAVDNDYLDALQHGTAVCSVAMGSPDPTSLPPLLSQQNRGVAPAARLVFMDVAPQNDDSGFLEVPSPLDTEYFPWFVNNGAYVSSQSWGSTTSVGYNSDTQAIDRFAYENPTHLPVLPLVTWRSKLVWYVSRTRR